ncbi:MAG: hypothetical protein JWQ09_4347, partial [Segetibacter sp.]|nr:hypothetical protein [Segetibacter sp.]
IDAPGHDHTFLSPTYKRELIQRIDNYIISGGKNL